MEPGNRDRISQLPDPILHHILSSSFLDIKHAGRTCVLSKRWRNVWKSMHNLSFCDDEIEYMFIDFPTFVNTVLRLRDPLDVHSLHIRLSNRFIGYSHLTAWLQYAVDHNVKKLEIYGPLYKVEFLRCIFTCPTLEDLVVLSDGPYIILPEVVCLGRLRKLHIRRFYSCPILWKPLIFGCPVLEDLHLEGCVLEDPDISSNSIKKLDFEGCALKGTRMRISVPSLQSLEISGNDILGLEFLLENLSSLVKASLQAEDHDGRPLAEHGQEFYNIRAGPRNKYEAVSGEVLSELQSFNKLQKLKLHGWRMVVHFPTVVRYLQHSPNLERLTLLVNTGGIFVLVFVQEGSDSFLTSKKWFVCAHRKLYVISQCGAENARIFELMTDFFNSKCGCFRE